MIRFQGFSSQLEARIDLSDRIQGQTKSDLFQFLLNIEKNN